MSYLYGDSTPSPLAGSFLDLLVAVTETAVSVLHARDQIEGAKARAQRALGDSDRDAKWLAGVGQAVAALIEQQARQAPSPRVEAEARQLLRGTKSTVEVAKTQLLGGRDQVLRELEAFIARRRTQMESALERLLLKHELPGSLWGVSWKVETDAGRGPDARAVLIAPCGIEATFRLDVPAQSLWSRPVRVDELVSSLSVRLPQRSLLRHTLRPTRTALSRLFVTSVELSPQRCALTLQRRDRPSPRGDYHIEQTAGGVRVEPASAAPDPLTVVLLDGAEGEPVQGLIHAVTVGVRSLVVERGLMTAFALGDQPLEQIADPVRLAQALIAAIASQVREIVKRSTTAGELCLKRDVGDHKREELFLPVEGLVATIGSLPPPLRGVFDALGLPLAGERTPADGAGIEAALLAVAS